MTVICNKNNYFHVENELLVEYVVFILTCDIFISNRVLLGVSTK